MKAEETIQYKPRIAAAIGPKAAGKDVLAEYLVEQYDAVAIEVGAFARKLAEGQDTHVRYDASSRELADYEPEYVMYRLVSEMRENNDPPATALVITGVHSPAEAAELKSQFGSDLLLAYVRVGDPETRYERTQKRNFTTDPDDLQAFKHEDEQMKETYDLEETAVRADTILWNNGSLESFRQQIEAKIVPHLFPQSRTPPS